MPEKNIVYQLFLSCDARVGEKRLSCTENSGLAMLSSFRSRPLARLSGNEETRTTSPCLGGQPVSLGQCLWIIAQENV